MDVYGNKVDYISLNYGAEKLTLTIPVLKVKQLSTHVTLTDAPESVDLSKIKVYYSTDSIRAAYWPERILRRPSWARCTLPTCG